MCISERECWCHLLNLMLKDIHDELKNRLFEIFNTQNGHGKSIVLHIYMESISVSHNHFRK